MSENSLQLLIIFACAVGTFSLRLLPLLFPPSETPGRYPRWTAFLRAIGPAAIAALFVASLVGVTHSTTDGPGMIALVAGITGTVLAHRLAGGGLAVSTLAGSGAYGVVLLLARWVVNA